MLRERRKKPETNPRPKCRKYFRPRRGESRFLKWQHFERMLERMSTHLALSRSCVLQLQVEPSWYTLSKAQLSSQLLL